MALFEPEIFAEHEDFWIISKPAGWTVQRDSVAPSVLEWLQQATGNKPLPVHRLDKPTSGLLLVARNDDANRTLSLAFAERSVTKTYLAISDRKPKKKQGWVKGDMAPSRRGQWKLLRTQEKPAITQFSSYLLEAPMRGYVLHPKTGKTHQLRVAMKSLGCPILGDQRYGGTEAERLYLHAWQLEFRYHDQQYSYRLDPAADGLAQWPFALPESN